MADENFRITYATLSADNEDLQRNYDEAVERARAELGKEWPFVVNGEERWTDEKYEEPSPIDSDIIIGRFSQASPQGRRRRRRRRQGASPSNGSGWAGRSGSGSSATSPT